MKISVKAVRTSDRAISLGVRWRTAPSTRAIIRSRNDSPGRAVMRTTIRSDSTSVPPVTPERSPPASRITGADSPVIADSSTEAMPSMISPSPGMICPVNTTTVSPGRKVRRGDLLDLRFPLAGRRNAGVSRRVRRRDSAWALPRSSARAVAKLAKSTVRNSQTSSAMKYVMATWLEEPPSAAWSDEEERQDGADLDDEHHRVLPLDVRPQHHERLLEGGPYQIGGEQVLPPDPARRVQPRGGRLRGHSAPALVHGAAPTPQPPKGIGPRCSASGPSAATGRKSSAPMMMMVPSNRNPKVGVSSLSVPVVIGDASFCPAPRPAPSARRSGDSGRTASRDRPRCPMAPPSARDSGCC